MRGWGEKYESIISSRENILKMYKNVFESIHLLSALLRLAAVRLHPRKDERERVYKFQIQYLFGISFVRMFSFSHF